MNTKELEKEAEKYADTVKCEWENDTYWVDCRDKVTDAYLASAEPREKRIEELEKENAELKEKLKPENCLKLLAKEGYIKFTSDQLTKAKEIIRKLVLEVKGYEEINGYDTCEPVQEAEQFLSEVEK